jgi:hypothetical protein
MPKNRTRAEEDLLHALRLSSSSNYELRRKILQEPNYIGVRPSGR